MANRSSSHYPDIGVLGEELVAQWLQSTGWMVLHRRWRCRWGEIDIIAHREPLAQQQTLSHGQQATENSPFITFVEVKTRSRGNWDAGGLLSITPQKQAKLWQTARCFLARYPKLASQPCRFDVALVSCQRPSPKEGDRLSETPIAVSSSAESLLLPVQLGQVKVISGVQLSLQDYIPSAFD